MPNEVRINVRIPGDAVRFLDEEARENFTSRNAQIVRAVRALMRQKTPEVQVARDGDAR